MMGLWWNFWNWIIIVKLVLLEVHLFIYYLGLEVIRVSFMIESAEESVSSQALLNGEGQSMLTLTSKDTLVCSSLSKAFSTQVGGASTLQVIGLKMLNYPLSIKEIKNSSGINWLSFNWDQVIALRS